MYTVDCRHQAGGDIAD